MEVSKGVVGGTRKTQRRGVRLGRGECARPNHAARCPRALSTWCTRGGTVEEGEWEVGDVGKVGAQKWRVDFGHVQPMAERAGNVIRRLVEVH